MLLNSALISLFLSTPSARRATQCAMGYITIFTISIHALREEGDLPAGKAGKIRRISIHALREEGDLFAFVPFHILAISIHALREEGDPSSSLGAIAPMSFLSTPSARRATTSCARKYRRKAISIHALREEGDSKNRDKISIFKQIIQHSARI